MSACFTCTRTDNTLSLMTNVYWDILNSLLSPNVNIDLLNHANRELHLCEECMRLLNSVNEFRSMAAECVLRQIHYWNENEDVKPCSIVVEMDEVDIKQERVSPTPDKQDIKEEMITVNIMSETNGPESMTCHVKVESQDIHNMADSEQLEDSHEAEPEPLCAKKPGTTKKTDKNKGHAKRRRIKPNKRQKPYTQAELEEAVAKIRASELTLTEAGKTYHIPKTTLHYQLHGKTPLTLAANRFECITCDIKREYLDDDRHIIVSDNAVESLNKQAKIRKRKARRKERLYSQNKLEEAVEKIRKDEITLTQASKTYDIPKTTLHSKLNGKTPLVCKKGPDRMLTNDEESYLAGWIADKIKNEGRVGVDDVKEAVTRLFEERGQPGVKPGMKWYRLFRQRHRDYFEKQEIPEIANKGLKHEDKPT